MIKKLLVAVSLASAIGLFSAAREVVEASFAEPAHNCMDHSGDSGPAVMAQHGNPAGHASRP